MRWIITGGTGLIGRQLVDALIHAGHHITVLSRNPERAQGLPADVRVRRWDGRTSAGWVDLVDEADGIVNLAGESLAGANLLSIRWTAERKHHILESRKKAGQAIVEAVTRSRYKPSVVLQVSAVGYYGPHDSTPLLEDTPPGSDFLAQVCNAWEQSTAPVTAFGIRQVVTRVGVVLSSEGGALPRQMLPFRLFAGGPIGSGKQPYPWIHIQDVAGGMKFLLEKPDAQGPFNLTAPNCVTNAEFSRLLGQAMHRPAWLPAPAFAFRLAFGEASIVLLEGQAPAPERLQKLGYQFQFPELSPALQDILKH